MNKKMADDIGYTLICICVLLVVAAVLFYFGILP